MKPGFYLRCGLHWTRVTEIYGGFVSVSADKEHATRFATRRDAEQVREWLEARPHVAQHEIVEIAEESSAAEKLNELAGVTA